MAGVLFCYNVGMFWLQLLYVLGEILMLLLKRRLSPEATRVAELRVKEMRAAAVRSRDLTELRAYRDALKNDIK